METKVKDNGDHKKDMQVNKSEQIKIKKRGHD